MDNHKNNQFRLFLSIIRIKEFLLNNYKKFRKRIGVFLVFVILATFFWLYRALDDVYVDDIRYPVKFENLPNNRILTTTPPKKISLRVRGIGYSILSKKLKAPTLTFDVNNFSLHSQSLDSLSVYLVTQKAKESLTQQLITENENLEIISIFPDTIYFNFAKTKQKKIPVLPHLLPFDELFAQQHTLNGDMIIKPDSVFIVGPSKIIDTLSGAYTKPILLHGLTDSSIIGTDLLEISGTKLSQSNVSVSIPVDKFTESSFDLPLMIKHEPDSLSLKVFPKSIQVKYKITQSNYSKISESDFRPYVDFKEIDTSNISSNSTLQVYIDSIPQFAFSTSVYPTRVEFLIENKNAEDRINRRNR